MANNKGFAYAYGWNVYYQKLLSLWPREGEGPIARQIGWVWAFLIFTVVWAPQTAGLSILWGDLNSNIDCLSINIPIIAAIGKILTLQWHRKVIGAILLLISEDWVRGRSAIELEIMMKTAKISRFISMLSFTIAVSANFNHNIFQLWSVMYIKKEPHANPRLALGLPFESYFPFDTTSMIIFVPLWIAQCIVTFISATSYTGTDAFVSMLVLHLCGQLGIICHSLKNLVTERTTEKPQNYWKKLGSIVRRHEELNQLAFVITETFSSILLVQVLACTLTFCFQGYVVFTAVTDEKKDAKFPIVDVILALMYSIYTITHLFMYCWVGDRLVVESMKISDAFYETAWYNLAPEEAKAFLFVFHRSNIPLHLTAGKFCTFNLDLFNSIMKNSMGYFSILIAMKERLID